DPAARLAEFDISYVGTSSQLPEKVATSLNVEFASAELISGLAANLDVVKAVTLLMNARARSEAMNRMDRGDYGGAQMALAAAARFTDDVAFSALPNDDQIQMDNFDLRDLEKSLDDRSNDMMSRKRMAYRRESIRKNK